MSTGNAPIDRQHQFLFQVVGDFREALEELNGGTNVYGLFLSNLLSYSKAHFRFEETCMLAAHCPAASVNQSAHRSFTKKIEAAEAYYEATGFDRSAVQTVVEWVEAWMLNHMGKIDVQLRGLPT
jgi:hemerythrin